MYIELGSYFVILCLHQVKSCDSLQLSHLMQSSKLLIMIMIVYNGDKRVSSYVYSDYIVIYNQISDNYQQVKKYIKIGYRIDHPFLRMQSQRLYKHRL